MNWLLMIEAALVGCKLFDHILGIIRPGIAEIEVAAELEHQARLLGAEGMSFETIVASGVRSALPHGRATAARLPRRGFVTLDFGVILKGYCSDMTRTVYLGTPKANERNAYEAVLGGPGGRCGRGGFWRKLRRCGRGCPQRFAQGGFGGGIYPLHRPWRRTGDSRAAAHWSRTNSQAGGRHGCHHRAGNLSAGQFGIRIEDMVAVTRTGGQVLTPAPKALIEL